MWRHSAFKYEPPVEHLQRKLAAVFALSLILFLALALPLEIRPAEASGVIYIRADGSVEPLSAPVSTIDKTTYLLTGKINDEIIIQRNNVTIEGNNQTVQGTGGGYGLTLNSVTGVSIREINVENFISGIWLYNSSNIHVADSNITENIIDDISIYSSSDNIIERNNVTGSGYGIYLSSSTGNSILKNVVGDTTMSGIFLENSNQNTITENVFNGTGLLVQFSYQNIIEDNTVNGKPLVFLESLSHTTVTEAGQVILVKCNHIQIENLDLSHSSVGIELFETIDSRIIRNNITDNHYGFWLYGSTNNSVIGNNIAENDIGIRLWRSSSNKLFHNNIKNNTQQVNDPAWDEPEFGISLNTWDDSYPSGGNFWGDYNDTDVKCGPNQDIDGSDGIGDIGHKIDANNQDQYPLIAPFVVFDARTWNGTVVNIGIQSNSSVTNLHIDTSQKSVTFDIATSDFAHGFCRVTLPNIIVQSLWHGNFRVLLNNEERPFRNWTDTTNTYIYINYQNSEVEVAIIPEIPSIMILSVFVTVSLLALATSKHTNTRLRRLR
jgi:parallel beta-helix repeat protein